MIGLILAVIAVVLLGALVWWGEHALLMLWTLLWLPVFTIAVVTIALVCLMTGRHAHIDVDHWGAGRSSAKGGV